jgi:multiple sugar transport system permease protein/raffinose/stachyose/melibiose transport system permease protein
LVLAAILAGFPVVYMVSSSLKPLSAIVSGLATLLPKHPSLASYATIFQHYPILSYITNSLWAAGASTLIAVVASTFAGYGFSRFQFRGKSTMLLFVLATQMFPSVMLFVPYYKLLGLYGLSNSLVGLVLVYTAAVIPFCSWMMYGFFNGVPRELDEAASIDGCGRVVTFVSVVAPLTLPGVISTTIYAFVTGWNEYMFAALFITSDSKKTLSVAIGQMAGFDSVRWNELMAASVVSSLPLLVVFLFLQRYFISGMTQGSVKG